MGPEAAAAAAGEPEQEDDDVGDGGYQSGRK